MFRYCYIGLSLVAIVVAVITVNAFGFADGLGIVTSLAVAFALPYAVARRCSWWSPGSAVALCAVSLILAASAIDYMWSVSLGSGATLEMPVLKSDPSSYYRWALHHYDGRCPEPLTTFFGFPLIILALWKVLGVSIVWPVAMNMSLTITAIAMSGGIAARLVKGRTRMNPATAATMAISLMCLHGFFLRRTDAF